MQKEPYLQIVAASAPPERKPSAPRRLRKRVRVHIGRARKSDSSRAMKAFAVLVLVCALYGLVFVLTHRNDPTPNIVTGPSGIATFFKNF